MNIDTVKFLIEYSGGNIASDPLSNVAESNSIFLLRNQNKSKAMTNIALE
jgi:hypothetical protein